MSRRSRREAAAQRLPVVVLAGNPNVGKSTLFNRLTGLRQHTGNWPGKTVGSAWSRCEIDGLPVLLADTPGVYSLLPRSADEVAARDAICFGGADAVVVVCDATCLERGLALVLQVLSCNARVAVCVNLMDEARRRGIRVDIAALEALLGVPVVGCSARDGAGVERLLARVAALVRGQEAQSPPRVRCCEAVERARAPVAVALRAWGAGEIADAAALYLLEGDRGMAVRLEEELGVSQGALRALCESVAPPAPARVLEEAATAIHAQAARIYAACVRAPRDEGTLRERLDRLLTSRATALAMMLALLSLVLYITIVGANAPSALLSELFAEAEARLSVLMRAAGAPAALTSLVCEGMLRVLGWVVAVMLPPMAIFFPLFTLLEDLGLLPRIAFNLDHSFKCCRACGKQALTMCMGLGCNAAGVTGCRIIESPRERLIAILTNAFMPCNGRFPMMMLLIGMFLAPGGALSALALAGVIVLGVAATFAACALLSSTVLRGVPSGFALEIPPLRRPQVGRVIVRSVLDRTLRVLGRAAAVAAPAGVVIWVLANARLPGGQTPLQLCVHGLDPLGRLLGMDGAILTAFVLALPANEIVLPLAMMAYLSAGALAHPEGTLALEALLRANGWTHLTALNAVLFSLMHWPCSTTLATIARETRSAKWTLLAAALPTLFGMAICLLTASVSRALGLA